jgi:glycosyltransferase involved in cell wall biosynthesis
MIFWILQTSEPIHFDNLGLRPMRAMNLANYLISKNHKVVLWTSDFDHYEKIHRRESHIEKEITRNLKIIFIKSPGYSKNISIRRLYDHLFMAANLSKMLKNKDKPDIAILGMPPIETAWIMAKWLNKHDVPFYIDIKDAWPEIFTKRSFFIFRGIIVLLTLPLKYARNRTLGLSAGISAPTKEFLSWAIEKSKRSKNNFDRPTPLTAPFDSYSAQDLSEGDRLLNSLGILTDHKLRLCFIGTLTTSYNFEPIIQAIKNSDIELIIAGSGPLLPKLQKICSNFSNIKILGWTNMPTSRLIMERSDAMVIPLKNSFDFQMSIPNKFYDAISMGLPIITCLRGSIKEVILKNGIGLIYDDENLKSFSKIIRDIKDDPTMLVEMSKKSKSVFKKFYSFDEVYGSFLDDLIRVAKL